jgi:hypothetical protein
MLVGVESVLVIGRIRPRCSDEVDALLAAGAREARVYRQAETLALLVESPHVEARFLHLLRDERGAFARLVACLEDLPLMPIEVMPACDVAPRRLGKSAQASEHALE